MSPGVVTVIGLAAILMGGLAYLARISYHDRARRHLVDRGLTPDEIQVLLKEPEPGSGGSLRTGLVLLAVGAAMIVIQYLPYGAADPVTYGLVLVSAGAALLLYLRLARRHGREEGPRR